MTNIISTASVLLNGPVLPAVLAIGGVVYFAKNY